MNKGIYPLKHVYYEYNSGKENFCEIQTKIVVMEIKYEIIIYWSQEDEAFIAEVPELAGCMADGHTYKDALENVQVIINEWLETARLKNKPIPQPKGRLVYA